MLCMMCRQHATFEHTVFRGTSPNRIRLCPDCAANVRAEQRLADIKEAADHDTKTAAVEEFLRAVGN